MKSSKIIRISIISILSYLIFIKSFDIFSILLTWTNLSLRIENVFIHSFSTVIIGIISLLILNYLYNHHLNEKQIKTKSIYELVVILILLTIIMVGINYLLPQFTENIEIKDLRKFYLIEYAWFKGISGILPIIALIIYLWKMKTIE